MECKKCKKIAEEGLLYDGKEWSLFDKESDGLALYGFFCRDCVEKSLSLLLDETIEMLEAKKKL